MLKRKNKKMALCKNEACRATLSEHHWGDGYCSRKCMAGGLDDGERVDDYLHDPTDPTGNRAIAKTADEVDAMLEAHAIDPRLPKIIYLRKRGMTFREIAPRGGMSYQTVDNLLKSLTPNLLRQCGLYIKKPVSPL